MAEGDKPDEIKGQTKAILRTNIRNNMGRRKEK